MQKRVAGVLAAAMVLAAVPAGADGMKIEPGKWEFQSTTHQPMLPQPITRTSSQCLTEPEMDPKAMTRDAKGCEFSEIQSNATSMKWTLRCKQDGGTMLGRAKATSTGTTVSGSMTMTMEFNGQKMEMKTEWKGKRVGDC